MNIHLHRASNDTWWATEWTGGLRVTEPYAKCWVQQ